MKFSKLKVVGDATQGDYFMIEFTDDDGESDVFDPHDEVDIDDLLDMLNGFLHGHPEAH
jgi:hypothetical protein